MFLRSVGVLCLLACWTPASCDSENKGFVVAAYLPEWRYAGVDWDLVSEGVTHLTLFSLEISPKGKIDALDRLPSPDNLAAAKLAAARHGTRLMICFGGNGRSNGFSSMVANKKRRTRFVKDLVAFLDEHNLDGVDYNWEYPGYNFRTGYGTEQEIERDYVGLSNLISDTRKAFGRGPNARAITAAYYPDGRQERLLLKHGVVENVDLLHIMAYDQTGGPHSTMDFGTRVLQQGISILPAAKLTLGVPFYGRHSASGEWMTYEDIVQRWHDLRDADAAPAEQGGTWYFNGPATIAAKTALAIAERAGGIMIWEVGQDCRRVAVVRDGTTHGVTCPAGPADSLLAAISQTLEQHGVKRAVHAHASDPLSDGANAARTEL